MLKGVFGLKETVLDMLSILSGEKKKGVAEMKLVKNVEMF